MLILHRYARDSLFIVEQPAPAILIGGGQTLKYTTDFSNWQTANVGLSGYAYHAAVWTGSRYLVHGTNSNSEQFLLVSGVNDPANYTLRKPNWASLVGEVPHIGYGAFCHNLASGRVHYVGWLSAAADFCHVYSDDLGATWSVGTVDGINTTGAPNSDMAVRAGYGTVSGYRRGFSQSTINGDVCFAETSARSDYVADPNSRAWAVFDGSHCSWILGSESLGSVWGSSTCVFPGGQMLNTGYGANLARSLDELASFTQHVPPVQLLHVAWRPDLDQLIGVGIDSGPVVTLNSQDYGSSWTVQQYGPTVGTPGSVVQNPAGQGYLPGWGHLKLVYNSQWQVSRITDPLSGTWQTLNTGQSSGKSNPSVLFVTDAA